MNTETEVPSGAPVTAAAAMPVTRSFYWSVRRELWEYRSIYLAPVIVAGFVLLGFIVVTIGRAMATADLVARRAVLVEPYTFTSLAIMGTATLVAVFYCLDALYGERRDRSVLFWKSMPVSDVTTVLAKAFIPIVLLPLIAFAVTVAVQFIMLLLTSLALSASDLDAAAFWRDTPFIQRWVMLLHHMVGIHGFWYAPIYGWLLLVSAWARRMPFLWAAMPLIGVAVVERVAFNSTYFLDFIRFRFSGGPEGGMFIPDSGTLHPLAHLSPFGLVTSGGMWAGLVLAALLLAGAVCLRRNRDPL